MTTEEILNNYDPNQQNLLRILLEIQKNNPNNYLPEEDLDKVVRYLKVNRSHVYGVVTYYSMLSLKPRGRHIIRLCCSPVCKLLGTDDVLHELEKLLRIKPGETTSDEQFTLEFTECLGYCYKSPAMLIDEDIYGNLNDEDLSKIIEKYR